MENKRIGKYGKITVGLFGYIYTKLSSKGYSHELYQGLATLPTKNRSPIYSLSMDELLPEYKYLGSGSQNWVFYNKQTKKVNKFPNTILSTTHQGNETTEETQMDVLVDSIEKAVQNNVVAVILKSKKLSSTVSPNSVIIEELIDTNKPANLNDLGWKAKKYFYIDPFRKKGNYFWQKDGTIAVVDGLSLIPEKASSDKQKSFFEKILVQETDRIIGRLPYIN